MLALLLDQRCFPIYEQSDQQRVVYNLLYCLCPPNIQDIVSTDNEIVAESIRTGEPLGEI